MRSFQLFRRGLAAKLAICVVVSTAAFFALFGFINLRVERAQMRDFVAQSAYRITDLIQRSTRYEMLHNVHDHGGLINIIQELGSQPGIRRIRILDPDGRITLSTDPAEVGRVAGAPDRAERRDFIDPEGQHVFGVVRPIENAPECSNAACHVHPASRPVLGAVNTHLSLAAVDRQIAEQTAKVLYFLIGAIILGSVLAVAFIWQVVYRPVKELIDGTHRVAGGDLEYRLPVGSEDELGDLAISFNRMTAEVGGVQAKIEAEVERKTAELERIHKTLLRSEKMASIGKLAATVAHEINNPLFGILTYARLVSRELVKHEFAERDELCEQVQTIERESKRCGELVKNLLTFSRQAPSNREPNDLNTVVHRAVMLVKHKLEMQNIELTESLAADLPPVHCDANQIQQVALVLLVNAAEAMPKGGKLLVSTAPDAAGGHGVVRVKDTGGGIPEDVLPRIFDPFFTTKEDQNRTGLGLAVAHSIVEQHAGEITVRSTPGEGTEFLVELPISSAGEPACVGGPNGKQRG